MKHSILATILLGGCIASTPRADTMHPVTEVPGLAVAITPEGELGWQIAVRNDTPDLVQVDWDDSTFVAANGQSMGRIVRGFTGTTRHQDVPHELALTDTRGGAAQAPSPIAPGATMTDWAVPESFLGEHGTPPQGRLTLVFHRAGTTQTWQGIVVPPSTPAVDDGGWWCVDVGDSGAPPMCARDQDQCALLAIHARKLGHEVGECIARN